jgi:hypothetical protein
MKRRGFLYSLLAAGAAPAFVRPSSLMPIKAPPIWVPRGNPVALQFVPVVWLPTCGGFVRMKVAGQRVLIPYFGAVE